MIEKSRISSFQMAIMMYPTILATAILLVPSITGKFAERDMWLSPILASSIGFLNVFLAVQLNKLYPKMTLIEYSEKIIGLIPGKILGFAYLFFYLQTNGIVFREYGEFVVGNFLSKTPMIVVIGSMALVCAFSVRGGAEVIARSAQIFVPLVVILLLFIFILLVPDLEPKNMFPIMDKGIMPSFMGSVVPASWFSEYTLIAFLLPFLHDRGKGLKWGFISVFTVMITMVVTNMSALFLFGSITDSFTYPVMSAARYIDVADFLQHLESIVMAIWVAGTFVKISVFYYALVLGTAQWLNMSDYRTLVLPLGFLLVIFSLWTAPNLIEMVHYLTTTWVFNALTMQVAIPILLLILGKIRRKRGTKVGSTRND
ncbi:spore germination protein KB [Scopulibacillus darangshiensis]|uniref:Spore germination protein KB n=1 Tax=Scopulibacillus darangshiensis TaxID=442528 RepID=A0A4R2P5H0_9BACL|nr:endospore germination permease [Scopulibacillus darangshiensis]TCP29211.1 spore germination protein KB [Scopulibacillus darangshiensis]